MTARVTFRRVGLLRVDKRQRTRPRLPRLRIVATARSPWAWTVQRAYYGNY